MALEKKLKKQVLHAVAHETDVISAIRLNGAWVISHYLVKSCGNMKENLIGWRRKMEQNFSHCEKYEATCSKVVHFIRRLIHIETDLIHLIIAGTRREEIARFSRAKTDQEFAKILKARTLGPEHSETQIQLRKHIRVRGFRFVGRRLTHLDGHSLPMIVCRSLKQVSKKRRKS